MNEEENGKLRSVAWSEVLPWLILFRTFRLAIGFRSLVLAAVGSLLMIVGWWGIGSIFCVRQAISHHTTATAACELMGLRGQGGCPFRAITSVIPDRPWLLTDRPLVGPGNPIDVHTPHALQPISPFSPVGVLVGSWQVLTSPLLGVLQPPIGISRLAGLALMGLWSLAVWAFFGAAITRTSSVQLACDERLTWGSVLRHTISHWRSYFTAPLFPAIGMVLIALPIGLLGLLARSSLGLLLLFLVWPLFLMGGLLMVLLLLGLLFGWPLMWSTISTEGTDAFDALSRSYAYVFQRPLHYLFYVIVAGILGWLGWLLVSEFTAGVVWLTYCAASWGGGVSVTQIAQKTAELGTLGKLGAAGIYFWIGCVKWFAVSYLLSYFWTTSSAIYLLLRRGVDGEETDKVSLEEDEPVYDLPPLKTEGVGAPSVSDRTSETGSGNPEKARDEE